MPMEKKLHCDEVWRVAASLQNLRDLRVVLRLDSQFHEMESHELERLVMGPILKHEWGRLERFDVGLTWKVEYSDGFCRLERRTLCGKGYEF